MLNRLEDFFFGQVFGRVVARVAVSGAAYLVGQAAAAGIHVDAGEVSSALIAGANALYTYVKDWRDKRAAAAKEAVPAK